MYENQDLFTRDYLVDCKVMTPCVKFYTKLVQDGLNENNINLYDFHIFTFFIISLISL
jgi:hypothetical protein